MFKMLLVQHVFLLLTLMNIFISSVAGQCNNCTSPSMKNGCCVPLQQCSYMYEAITNNRVDSSVKGYLRNSVCKVEESKPIVCCEDAYDCITPQNQAGACMPFNRCEPILKLLETVPFLNDTIINYMREAECGIDSTDVVRFCCPIFYDTISL